MNQNNSVRGFIGKNKIKIKVICTSEELIKESNLQHRLLLRSFKFLTLLVGRTHKDTT